MINLEKIDQLPFHKFKSNDGCLGLSNSKATTWLTCRKKFYYEYDQNLKLKTVSEALQIGNVVHYLLAKFYKENRTIRVEDIENLEEVIKNTYKENTDEETLNTAFMAAKLVAGYAEKYIDDPLDVFMVEKVLYMPRIEKKKGYFYIIHGTIDSACRTTDKRCWQLEHKTTARMDNLYLRGLRNTLQGRLYNLLLNYYYEIEFTGIIYNILVKTKIPQFERQPLLMSRKTSEEVLNTFDGIVRELYEYDVYPNFSQCVQYNRECPYLILCQEDNEKNREAFYYRRAV